MYNSISVITESTNNSVDIVTEFKNVVKKYDLNLKLYSTDAKTVKVVLNNIFGNFSIDGYFSRLISMALSFDYTNRTVTITRDDKTTAEFLNLEQPKRRLYELTKFFDFMYSPPSYYRTPINMSINFNGSDSVANRVTVHPGTFRLASLSFLPDYLKLNILVLDNVENKLLNNGFKMYSRQLSINRMSNESLHQILNIDELYNPSVKYTPNEGAQIVEYAPTLPEHNIDYIITIQNMCCYVNDKCIACYDNNRKLFVPIIRYIENKNQ